MHSRVQRAAAPNSSPGPIRTRRHNRAGPASDDPMPASGAVRTRDAAAHAIHWPHGGRSAMLLLCPDWTADKGALPVRACTTCDSMHKQYGSPGTDASTHARVQKTVATVATVAHNKNTRDHCSHYNCTSNYARRHLMPAGSQPERRTTISQLNDITRLEMKSKARVSARARVRLSLSETLVRDSFPHLTHHTHQHNAFTRINTHQTSA